MHISAPGFSQLDHLEITQSPDRQANVKRDATVERSVPHDPANDTNRSNPTGMTLHFSEDPETGRVVVKVIDTTTGTAIRQFPTDSSLWVSEIMGRLAGRHIDKQV